MHRTARRATISLGSGKRTREDPISTGKAAVRVRRFISILFILALTVSLGSQVGNQNAWAEPAAITKAKQEAAALKQRIDELADQLDEAVEDYNYARARLSETEAAAEETQKILARAEKDLRTLSERFDQRLAEIYKQGQMGIVSTLSEATSFSDFVNRLDLLKRVSEQDSRMVEEVLAFHEEVTERKAQLAVQLEEQQALRAETEAAKQKVEERLAANEHALKGKEKQIAQLQKEERERQERLAAAAREAARKAAEEAAARREAEARAEAARRAAAAQAQREAAPTSGSSSNSGGSSSSSSNSNGGAPRSSSIGGDVVSIAMQYRGTPYVWAASSPSGFDCSGFVKYVFAKVGVSLPHSSRMQYGYGVAVSRANLQPGDLVFFYNPIHHVGIYIGGGKMIHAAGKGKDVRIDEVWTRNYTGARRILN